MSAARTCRHTAVTALASAVLGSGTAVLLRSIPDLAPYATGWVLLPPADATLLLFGLTVLVVAIGSVIPARRAAKMPPHRCDEGLVSHPCRT
ncbi:ABC transporter permease family protein [Streptomyces solincola]|uniref:ABC transporter permease n=1 Tax=Streptomyces solincola TaxID=2100817 RepID=UPI0015E489B9|nr:ABC transporter permease [Streptomyces solincola]